MLLEISNFQKKKVENLSLEVSSHGLKQNRILGIEFDTTIFSSSSTGQYNLWTYMNIQIEDDDCTLNSAEYKFIKTISLLTGFWFLIIFLLLLFAVTPILFALLGSFKELKDMKPLVTEESDLKIAMKMIATTQKGPKDQVPSMGCNIKWFN